MNNGILVQAQSSVPMPYGLLGAPTPIPMPHQAYARAPIVTDGLVLHLDAGNPASYPGSGTTWFDLSGNGNNYTLVNNVPYESANGGCLAFNGTNHHMTSSPGLSLSTDNGFTMCLFIRQNQTQNNGAWNYFWSRFSPTFEIGKYGTSGTGFEFKSNFGLVTTSSTTDSWIYICFGTNTTTRRPFIHLFNSLGYFFNSSSNSFPSAAMPFERMFTTGALGGFGTNYFGARCAIIKAYNRTLNLEEIQQNFNATRSRFGI